MANTNLKQTRRDDFYRKEDGTLYISTTSILKVINKPALVYWFGREVYRALLKDPTLDEKTALAAPYAASGSARSRGTTVHSIVEAYKQTGAILTGIPQEFQGYASAFYQFMADHKVDIIEQEKTIFDDENKVAGTLDMYNKIGDHFHVTDVKTGKDIYDEVRLQLSSYAHMMRLAGHPVDEISVLLLETGEDGLPTGKYKFQTVEEDFDAFMAVKKIYEWSNKEKLLKVGYTKKA